MSATTNQQEPRGLFPKYRVLHGVTGEELDDCFVLRPRRDPLSRPALAAYAAAALASGNHELWADLNGLLEQVYQDEARYGSALFVQPRELSQPTRWLAPERPPGNVRIDACRSDKCRAPVFFGRVLKKDGTLGKPTPVDWPPVEGYGHMLPLLQGEETNDPQVRMHGGHPCFRNTTQEERTAYQAAGVVLYTGHYATCPDADSFRVNARG